MEASNKVVGREKYAEAAAGILEYAETRYGLYDLKLVFLEGEDGELDEIQLFAQNCPYAIREAMAQEIGEAFSVRASVFSEP